MPALNLHETVDRRLREAVRHALEGCAYESSSTKDGVFVLDARRPDGRKVQVRFLGVKSSTAEPRPPAGASLALQRVQSARKLSLLDIVLFWRLFSGPSYGTDLHARRVTITAGETQIEVVCEDAEWFEEQPTPGRPAG